MNNPAPRGSRRARGYLTALLSVIGVVAVTAAVAGCGSLTSGGGSPSSGGTDSLPTVSPAAATAHIGDKVRDGKFEFTVTGVTYAKSVGDTSMGLGQTAQGRFTILHIKVTNIGTESQSLSDSAQFVRDAQGRKFDASTAADLYITGNDVLFNNINPGNTVHGLIAFDMPANDKAVTVELHDSLFSGGVTVSLS